MDIYQVVYAPEAEAQLLDLFEYIASAAGDGYNAAMFADQLTRFCDGFERFPKRGDARDDIRPGVRVTNYEGRTVIAFTVDDHALRVEILGIFYGGQDYARQLSHA
nr:type II toxin-antitoxin system RelE/ParE family toxin [Dyella sp. ASV24]